MKFKYQRKLTLTGVVFTDSPIFEIRWRVPASRKYRLRVSRDRMFSIIEYNDSADLPTVSVTADGVRTKLKLK